MFFLVVSVNAEKIENNSKVDLGACTIKLLTAVAFVV
jgi:hypothetical protein